jgi:phosphoadenosine phosphosulfate reductase
MRIKTMAPIAENLFGGYTVMVSGGKDSTVITDLAIRSGIKCSFSVSWTGIELPETVRFLRAEKQRVENLGYSFEFHIPRDENGKQITMWKLIEKSGFPSRMRRFCCAKLKEENSNGKYVILGVRWAESVKRKSRTIHENHKKHNHSKEKFMSNNDNEAFRRLNEVCMKRNQYILNPIIDWTDADVWEYIRGRNLPRNPLYDMGYKRVGCIGCQMRPNRKDLEENPRYAALYKKAGAKHLMRIQQDKLSYYKDADTYYDWWVRFCEFNTRDNEKGLFDIDSEGEGANAE